MRERIADSIKKRSEGISSKAVWHVSTTKQEQIRRRNHVKKMYTYDEDAFRNGFRATVNNYFKLENPPDTFFKKPEETLTKNSDSESPSSSRHFNLQVCLLPNSDSRISLGFTSRHRIVSPFSLTISRRSCAGVNPQLGVNPVPSDMFFYWFFLILGYMKN